MKKHITPLLLLLALCSPLWSAPAVSQSDSLLAVYDNEVMRADYYLHARQERIDSLKRLPSSPERNYAIAEEYFPYQCDSSLTYYAQVTGVASASLGLRAALRRCYLLAAIGSIGEASLELNDIQPPTDTDLRILYYRAYYRLYEQSKALTRVSSYMPYLEQLQQQALDSLLSTYQLLSPVPCDYYRYSINKYNLKRDYKLALAYSDSSLVGLDDISHDYAIYAYERAIIYKEMGMEEAYYNWLIRSAITDIRCAVTDNGSSWVVAEWVHKNGNYKRSYAYINYSLTNARFFGAPSRAQQIEPLALYIRDTHEKQQTANNIRLWFFLVLSIVILFVAVVEVVYAVSRNKKLHALNQDLQVLNLQLEEANSVKEQYICRYLEVYSDNINRMAKMARKTEKDPDDFLRKEMAVFYTGFDRTFVTLYPTFVNDFNALLQPDFRLKPKKGELLTTELRIFALMRLGIDSSTKIAQLLCYAPNTIYNYRAQVRNHALDRERFEQQVHHIGRPQPL